MLRLCIEPGTSELRLKVMTKAMPGLAVSSNPNLPAVEGKIHSADDYPCNREDGCRDVRLNLPALKGGDS